MVIVMMRTKLQSCRESWRRLRGNGPRRGSKRSEQAFLSDTIYFRVPLYVLHHSAYHTDGILRQEREKAAAEEAEREKDIALGNPLLITKTDFNVKRRYVYRRALPKTLKSNLYYAEPQHDHANASIDGMTM